MRKAPEGWACSWVRGGGGGSLSFAPAETQGTATQRSALNPIRPAARLTLIRGILPNYQPGTPLILREAIAPRGQKAGAGVPTVPRHRRGTRAPLHGIIIPPNK